jgi:hypothetical protein
MKKEEEEQKLLEASSPEILRRAVLVEPTLVGTSPVQIMKNLRTMKQSGAADDKLAAIFADDESLLALTIGKRNASAAKILVAKEASATGRDIADITNQLKFMDRALTDDSAMEKMARQVISGEDEMKAYKMAQRALRGGTKQEREAGQSARVNLLLRATARDAENKFLGNVIAWKGYDDPALQLAITKAQEISGKTSMEEVLAAYLGESTGVERRAKLDRFRENIFRAADAGPSKSLLAPVDSQAVINRMEQLAIGRSLGSKLKDIYTQMDPVAQRLQNPMAQAALAPKTAYEVYSNFFGD